MTIDPRMPIVEGNPSEWEELPSDLLDMLRPSTGGLFTKEQHKMMKKIAASRWFLLKNIHGFRCKRCNGIHRYLTTACVERPFHGLQEIMGLQRKIEREHGSIRGERMSVEDARTKMTRLGAIEPINRKTALRYQERIKQRTGK
jgi:hypothetical protein